MSRELAWNIVAVSRGWNFSSSRGSTTDYVKGIYERANSSKVGSGMPAFQVGSRNSNRLPLGSKK